ncbi:hypothetical protein ACWGXJ_25400 [Paenibacillus sp. S33]
MTTFSKQHEEGGIVLYVSDIDGRPIAYWSSFSGEAAPDHLTLSDACFKYTGYMVFSAVSSEQFIRESSKIYQTLSGQLRIPQRSYIWLSDPKQITEETVSWLGVRESDGVFIETPVTLPIVTDGWSLQFSSGVKIGVDVERSELIFEGEISFSGATAPRAEPFRNIRLSFTGPGRGYWVIERLFIPLDSLAANSGRMIGFQFVHPLAQVSLGANLAVARYPLIPEQSGEGTPVQFTACIDTCDRFLPGDGEETYTGRSFLAFSRNGNTGFVQQLPTHYVTKAGKAVVLSPVEQESYWHEYQARLLFQSAVGKHSLILSPSGDFEITESDRQGQEGRPAQLLGGLSGTEFFVIPQSCRLRFHPNQAAYAWKYPFPEGDSYGPPAQKPEEMLQHKYVTSWVSVIPKVGSGESSSYVSQPPGSTLYSQGDLSASTEKLLLDFKPTPVPAVDEIKPYPLVPYGGVKVTILEGDFDPDKVREFEEKVISPVRRHYLKTSAQPSAEVPEESAATFYDATTPNGQLVRLSGSLYKKVLLGSVNLSGPETEQNASEWSFESVDERLQKALQTNQLFIVATSRKHLGADKGTVESGPVFNNKINIDGWVFHVDVGSENAYLNYSNVLIMKGRTGAGQSLAELAERSDLWTQPEDFVQSHFGDDASIHESGDLQALSRWIKDYIEEAKEIGSYDPAMAHFNALVQDPYWTGILVLKATITDFPKDIGDLTQLTADNELRFYAHHFGLETSVAKREMTPPDESKIFGLIRYQHPGFSIQPPHVPVQVDNRSAKWDFSLLYLKVAIREGRMVDFSCLGQLTMDEWFGHRAAGTEGGSRYTDNALILEGTSQVEESSQLEGSTRREENRRTYMLETRERVIFQFDSNIAEKVTVDKAKYISSPGNGSTPMLEICGSIIFRRIEFNGSPYNLMSFGEEGLKFNSLTIAKQGDGWDCLTDRTKFELMVGSKQSGQRSLVESLPLELIGYITDNRSITDLGYWSVGMAAGFYDVGSGPWNGLRFRLQAGSLGGLSDNKPLEAELLLAWGPGKAEDPGRYELSVGLKFPGLEHQFKLQNVIPLEFNDINLTYNGEKNTFELEVSEMFFRFLGLRFPPVGSMSLIWFGGGDRQHPLGWYASYVK